jgi:hypothetical protein
VVAALTAGIVCAVGRTSIAEELSTRVPSATSVIAYRILDPTSLDLRELHFDAKVNDPNTAKLSRNAAHDLSALVTNPGTFVEQPAFVSSCPFSPDYVYEFCSPHRSPVWWLVATGCGRAATVETTTPASEWMSHAKYLSSDGLNALKKCNAGAGSAAHGASQASSWLWSAKVSCLSK